MVPSPHHLSIRPATKTQCQARSGRSRREPRRPPLRCGRRATDFPATSALILLDTSGLVGLFDRRDGRHADARAAWSRVRRAAAPLLVTDLIVAETVTLLRRRAGHAVAVRAGDRLMSGDVAEMVVADAELLEKGWLLFRAYHDEVLSLTDCGSFALMKQRRIAQAFAFDDDFRAAGFRLV